MISLPLLLLGCYSNDQSKRNESSNKTKSDTISVKHLSLYAVDTIFQDYLPDTALVFATPEELREYYFSSFKKFKAFCNQFKESNENKDSIILAVRQAEIRYQDLTEVNYMKFYKNWKRDNESMNLLSAFSPNSQIISLQEREKFFKSFPPKIQNNEIGKKTWQKFQEYSFDRNIGSNLHQFDSVMIKNQASQNERLEKIFNHQFQYYVLVFGASWCYPCRIEEKQLKYWIPFIDTTKIKIIGLSIDRDFTKWKKYLNDDKLPWSSYLLQGVMNNEMIKALKFQGVPRNFLLDTDGKVLAENTDIRKILKRIPLINTE